MQRAEKLSITLPSEMVRVVREKVRGGSFRSASEVIRAALRAWLETEKRLQSLDDAIAEGIADVNAGRILSVDEVRETLRTSRETVPPPE